MIVHHLNSTCLYDVVGCHRVNGEAHKCYAKPENGDVAQVLEKLLPPHIKARVEDDGRQQEVEKEVLTEAVLVCSLVAVDPEQNETQKDPDDDCVARLVPTAGLVFLKAGCHEEERNHDAKQNADKLELDLLLALLAIDRAQLAVSELYQRREALHFVE